MTELETKLRQLPLGCKNLKVLNDRSIIVTCYGRDSADKWADALRKFCRTVRGPVESIDHNATNTNTVLRPTRHRVWRVGGTV